MVVASGETLRTASGYVESKLHDLTLTLSAAEWNHP